jgi:hypothetical protein
VAVSTRTTALRVAAATMPFDKRLVLSRYMLGLFGASSFRDLAEGLTEPEYEEWDEDNVSQMFYILAGRSRILTGSSPEVPSPDDLRRYDANIVSFTLQISRRRPERIRWRYFQYLALLFTEIYLDRYFSSSARRCNRQVRRPSNRSRCASEVLLGRGFDNTTADAAGLIAARGIPFGGRVEQPSGMSQSLERGPSNSGSSSKKSAPSSQSARQ